MVQNVEDLLVVRGVEPAVEDQQQRKDDPRFHPLAGGDPPSFERRQAEFDRNGQQPRHALFGERVHDEMRRHADHKRPPHQADVHRTQNRVQKDEQEMKQVAKQHQAQDRVRQKPVAAEQFVENLAEILANGQVAPQRRRGLVDIGRNAADEVGEDRHNRRRQCHGALRRCPEPSVRPNRAYEQSYAVPV